MPRISFAPNKKISTIEVERGTTIMQALLAHQRPVASSCLGKGICSKCHVQILSGENNLSPETDLEKSLRERNGIPIGYRISCQAQVLGDVKIDTGYW